MPPVVHEEPEFEALLRRLIPGIEQHWEGASKEEYEIVEWLVEVPLPPFYQWFLRRMGRACGHVAAPRRDLGVANLIAAYRALEFFMEADRFFIGRDHDDIMPMVMFYDLSRPMRDDARIISRVEVGGPWQETSETLREMLGISAVLRFGVRPAEHQVSGTLRNSGCEVVERMRRVLLDRGFEEPIVTGEHCGLFIREDQHLAFRSYAKEPTPRGVFRLGGARQAVLRQVLGQLAVKGDIEVTIESER